MPLLNWLNKDSATKAAAKSAYRVLEEVPELSYGDADSENLLIQGDNLEALKALIPFYAGKVKCIFIDPPYNTKSAFEHYDDNLEHSQWLSLMYPRLDLLRELLSEDGSIWVTIDDNEAHYLKVIMDEIFGRKNFIGSVVWQHSIQGKNDARYLSLHHNYLISYRQSENFTRNLFPRTEEHNKNYTNPDKDINGPWRAGDVRSPNLRENLKYQVITPNKKVIEPPENGWRWSKDLFEKKVLSGEITFINDDTKVLRKIYLKNQPGRVPESIWFGSDAGTTRDANRHLKQVLSSTDSFGTPKPEELIQRVLHVATNENDLILDSFLGSGTTAAVANKMNRRYMGIELGEHAITHCQPRLQKVIDGEQGGISKSIKWQGGGGFKFVKLGETVFDEYGCLNPAIKFPTLAAYIWYIETRLPLTANKTNKKNRSPFIGIHNQTAYYLLFNGILGDKRPSAGNVLTSKVLKLLPEFKGKKIIYGETTRLGEARLAKENIIFKQIPYEVKAL